jgi:hypothetical protein
MYERWLFWAPPGSCRGWHGASKEDARAMEEHLHEET